jgi:hypothetical protein
VWSVLVLSLALACGGKSNPGTPEDDAGPDQIYDDAGNPLVYDDAGNLIVGGDAGPVGGAGCDPLGPKCNNCMDDDGDQLIDGYDPECISSADNDEHTFATGIPGDNMDFGKQDCFFDGNSGAGDDGCELHPCCLIQTQECYDAHNGGNAPSDCDGNAKNDCTPGVDCCGDPGPAGDANWIDCSAITPPGCDCFGCCTLCKDGTCKDVPLAAVNTGTWSCDSSGDLSTCPTCTKSTTCNGGGCNTDQSDCVLCPGETEANLPMSCNMQPTCPAGVTACSSTTPCPDGKYCSSGCCVYVVE